MRRRGKVGVQIIGGILRAVSKREMKIMKTLKMIITFCLVFVCLSFFVAPAARGQTVTMNADDLAQLRKIAADREFQKNRADEAERQSSEWQRSSERWRGLYESEKRRADEIQEKRVSELNAAVGEFRTEVAELRKANGFLQDQAKSDKEQIGQLNFDVRKLKSERKFYFAGGVGVGAVGGFYIGKNIGKAQEIIVNTLSPPASRNSFRATFQF
jgi:hypothetical protein